MNELRILTEINEIGENVNPINQAKAHDSRSDKYKVIRSDKIIEVFQDNGLEIVGQSFKKCKDSSKLGFQKHVVVFSNDSLDLGEERLQLLLTNSHDGSCSYQLDLGVFRMVCANGLVDGNSESMIKVRHTGNVTDKLDKAIRYQLDRLPQIAAKINEFKNIDLDQAGIDKLTLQCLRARLGDSFGRVAGIRSIQAKRHGDVGSDLWTVFNRIQERVIRGGFSYFDNDKEKWSNTRKLTGVDSVIKVNKKLWRIAEEMKKAA